jgi:PiT family inorganic phosphate transporter
LEGKWNYFTNGFHDTANAIATVVSTKAVPPKVAVIGAALLNFLGAFLSIHVATTIAKGIVIPEAITLTTVLAGLLGAIVWNLVTWRAGLPSSSSHALIGGVIGSSVMALGFGVIQWNGIGEKVLVPSLLSPFLGMLGAGVILVIIMSIIKRYSATTTAKVFKRLQLVSGSFVAFSHGTNDAQKTMGIIVLALMAAYPHQKWGVPVWVIVASALAMALGTYVGGWRIIHTLGEKITHLTPVQGFAAETATAAILLTTSSYGLPVSTTHTISGSILGAGAAADRKSVNWKIVKHILTAWLVTIPITAVVGGLAQLVTRLPYGTGILLLLAVVVVLTIYVTRDWTREEFAQVKNLMAVVRERRKKSS